MEFEKNNEIDIKAAKPYTKWDEIKRWIPSIIILPVAIYWCINRGNYGLIDNVDLVIHEAGHVFFTLFGKFIYTLGGTLMQIIIPGIIAWFFLRNNYRTGVQFALLWLGQNLINISVYAADAKAQKLHLLGGNRVYHDWNYLLNQSGLLEYDQTIGYIIFATAIIIFIAAVLMPLITRD
ncbi:hypothetical protein BMS3Abin03_03212 [bacterium BMS3Abin03]|nr:hypothetical protein BMS3Abin03_03212 [bacterium BMS3Abin03]